MPSSTPRFRPALGFWLMIPLAGAITWAIHELAHFQMGRWLGYEMWLSMNQAGTTSEAGYETVTHRMLVAMAGPVVTYAQAAVALALIFSRRSGVAYVFLFFAAFTRLLAFAVSCVAEPNDEARTSVDLGLPFWGLPALVVAVLVVMTVVGSRALRVGWRTNALLYLAASAITTAVVFGDPVVGRLIEG